MVSSSNGTNNLGGDPDPTPVDGEPPQPLRFGTHLASNEVTLGFQEFVSLTVGRRIGVPVEFVVETSYDGCLNDLNDVCFVCSLPYVEFEQRGLDIALPVAAPILSGSRYGGRPIYFSDVIVHRDSGMHGFRDLRGCTWAYNEPLSQSGYGIVRYHLARLGETNGFFGTLVEVGFHREAIRMVASGRVDAAAIDSHMLALEFRDHPELARLVKVVDSLGPSTIQPVAVSRRLPERTRELIRHVLLTMGDEGRAREQFASVMVDRFVAVDATDYDDIRAMVAFCEAVEFLELR